MQKIITDNTYFSPKDTLCCGQMFRYRPHDKGYLVFSRDKACYLYSADDKTIIECEDGEYFHNFFDLGRDYGEIVEKVRSFNIPLLLKAANICKGIRILNQDLEETVFSFIISQNNNIPRIKGIIERICEALGNRHTFGGLEYHSFPSAEKIASQSADFFKGLGLGYRDRYLPKAAKELSAERIEAFKALDTPSLKKALTRLCGVGPKVADCISLFAFHRTDSFPVDTWVEKVYREDFHGEETNRAKINKYFTDTFKDMSGYVQQYLFYYKREDM